MEGLKGGDAGCFGGLVARDGDVDDAAGCDVVWEEDGREFDLEDTSAVSMLKSCTAPCG